MQQIPLNTPKNNGGCAIWIAVAALVISVLGLLADIRQELAWDGRIQQLNALYTDIYTIPTDESQPLNSTPTTISNQDTITQPTDPAVEIVKTNETTLVASTQLTTKSPSAAEVINAFQSSGLPLINVTTYTAENDLNKLLGRPNQYTEKVSWIDNRIATQGEPGTDTGGTIEVFLSEEDLLARKEYVGVITNSASLLAEYSYSHGLILLRLSHDLTPDLAQAYENVLKAIVSGNVVPTIVPSISTPTPLPTWTPVPGPVSPKDARDSLFVHGNSSPPFPAGEQGIVSVVAVGRIKTTEFSSYSIVPVVVRNNTGAYVTRIGVSATARDANGGMLAAGGEQSSLSPNLVQPGEIAFGYIYFEGVKLANDTRFEFQADYSPAGDSIEQYETIRDLEVTEVNIVENRLVGLLRNQYNEIITGPIGIGVICFDESNQLLAHYSGYSDQDTASAGATVPYQLDLEENPCPIYLVAANGYHD